MYKFKEYEMKVPCFVWSKEIGLEKGAIKQITAVSSLPFVFHHTALMPDAHVGYGCPIGTVASLEGVVIPNLIGVDIGCGMMSQKTGIKSEEFSTKLLKQIMGDIRKAIPVGFKHRNVPCEISDMPGGYDVFNAKPEKSATPICVQEFRSAQKQLGTLGGGNHFIEIQKGSDGYVWIMIHSGSRNLGKKVADHYNKLAKELNEKWYSKIDSKLDLAFLPLNTKEAKNYINEMNYCVEFAKRNRIKMMEDIKKIFLEHTKCRFDEFYNINHNYAAFENHFGKNVLVHRKGATRARKGEIGIIPGSQGTYSCIVEGLGNKESFESCSHGAGRKMGRNDAKRTLNLEEEQKKLNDKGIVHSVRGVGELDEAPGAYKDITTVMENQKDLVKILIKLKPLGVIKG